MKIDEAIYVLEEYIDIGINNKYTSISITESDVNDFKKIINLLKTCKEGSK